MKIDDMFIDPIENLNSRGFNLDLREIPCEPDATRYLLYRLAIGHAHAQGSFSLSTRAYPAYGLLHLLSGSLQYSSQIDPEQSSTLTGDSLLLIDCHIPCKLSLKFAGEFEILYFDGYATPYFCNQLFKQSSFFSIQSAQELMSKYQLLLQDSCHTMLCNMYLTDLLTRMTLQIAPINNGIPSYLLQIKELFDTRYYEAHTLEELEQEFHINRYRICKEFKAHFHTSPLQYLHQVRILTAQALLREGELKIHEIAYEVGYESVNHFIHHFKKTAGTTPAEYRKNISSYL